MSDKKHFKYETYKEFYNRISETLNIGFMLADFDYNILEVNNRLLSMLDLTLEQKSHFMGHSIKEFFKNDDEFKEWVIELKTHDTRTHYQYEDNLRTLGGGDRAILVHVNRLPQVKRKGYRDGIATVLVIDIEEQKRTLAGLETANNELIKSKAVIADKNKILETVVFGIGDCVTIFDSEGKILLSNPKGNAIRGDRNIPVLPLVSGSTKEVSIMVDGKKLYFSGRMEGIYDNLKGELFAYVETLKDITNEIELESRTEELRKIKDELGYNNIRPKLIGNSKAIQIVLHNITRCANVSSPVLLLGETGVGKEIVARAIHESSDRKNKPFVAVNCGALPDNLIESELFGHVKGAFTGAITSRRGLFRDAHGGTLFLDEVGDIKLELQVKLLRVLQEGAVRPVGDSKTYPVDVRIISATNIDLKTLLEQKHFRHDLYYRLAVIPILVPPLRDRKEDILPLINHFVQLQVKTSGLQPKKLNTEALQTLFNYSWPGNIRELENAIEYAMAMATSEDLTPKDFPMLSLNLSTRPDETQPGPKAPDIAPITVIPARQSLKIIEEEKLQRERGEIFDALLLHEGNRTLAAKELGISKSTLWRKIKSTRLDQ